MSSIANITAFDGAATPVSHVFVPIGLFREGKRSIARWRENIPGVPVYAQPRITMYSDDRSSGGIYRVGVLVEVPVMEAVNAQNAAGYTAPPKVAHTLTDRYEKNSHERSTIENRRLSRMLLVNISNNITATTAAATAGPASELLDALVLPT